MQCTSHFQQPIVRNLVSAGTGSAFFFIRKSVKGVDVPHKLQNREQRRLRMSTRGAQTWCTLAAPSLSHLSRGPTFAAAHFLEFTQLLCGLALWRLGRASSAVHSTHISHLSRYSLVGSLFLPGIKGVTPRKREPFDWLGPLEFG